MFNFAKIVFVIILMFLCFKFFNVKIFEFNYTTLYNWTSDFFSKIYKGLLLFLNFVFIIVFFIEILFFNFFFKFFLNLIKIYIDFMSHALIYLSTWFRMILFVLDEFFFSWINFSSDIVLRVSSFIRPFFFKILDFFLFWMNYILDKVIVLSNFLRAIFKLIITFFYKNS